MQLMKYVWVLFVVPLSYAFSGFINWGNTSEYFDRFGNLAPSGWYLQLWSAGANNTRDWTPSGYGDDVLVGSGSVNSGNGWFYNVSSSGGGFWAYVVGYDSSSPASAGYYAFMGWKNIPPLPNPHDLHDFLMPGAVAGDWQPIPEPSALALMALGAVTLAAGHKLRKRS